MDRWPRLGVAISIAGSLLASMTAGLADSAKPRPGGFWKEKVGSPVKGEFGGEDPVGLASGKHIPTNCTIHRILDGGKIYCFSTLPSLEYLDSNRELLSQAEAFWTKEHPAARRQ